MAIQEAAGLGSLTPTYFPRRRARRIAIEHARRGEAFGSVLGRHEGVGFMADTEMDIRAGPACHPHTASTLD